MRQFDTRSVFRFSLFPDARFHTATGEKEGRVRGTDLPIRRLNPLLPRAAGCVLMVLLVPGNVLIQAAPEPSPRATQLMAYIGTYTGQNSEGIYAYQVEVTSGSATPRGCVGRTAHPSFLALHPSGRFVYAVSEVNSAAGQPGGAVAAFAVDRQTGLLTLLNMQASGGAGPCHLTVDRTGRHVLVANYGGGSVAVLPIREDGLLGEATCVVRHTGSSVHPRRQRQPHVHSVNLAPDNRHALVADLGIDRVVVYRFDAERGILSTPAAYTFEAPPGSGPRHLAFHPNGRIVLVLNELSSRLMLLEFDPPTGRLTLRQSVSTLPEGFSGSNTTAEVAVHPNGRFAYASNRGHDSIAVFQLDTNRWDLQLVQHAATGGRTPRHFALDPFGQSLWAANQASHTVVRFRVDPATGRLERVGPALEVGNPACVRFLSLDAPGPTPPGGSGTAPPAQVSAPSGL